MNARLRPFGDPLMAGYDHYGVKFDLYGTHSEESGYTVEHVFIAGTSISITKTVSEMAMQDMSEKLGGLLPSGEELREQDGDEMKIERAEWNRSISKLPELTIGF